MTLAASKDPILMAGIEAAKIKAMETSAPEPAGPEAADQEAMAADILDVMATDIMNAIHNYTITALVVVKADIDTSSSIIGDIIPLLSGGDLTEDGESDSYDSTGGGALGLTGLEDAKDALYEGILDAYTSVMEAGVADLEPSESTVDDEHIHDILATKLCDAVHAYVTSAIVKTTDEMKGGRTLAGGTENVFGTPIMGVTLPTRDGIGEGEVS